MLWLSPTLLGMTLFVAVPFVAVIVLATLDWRLVDTPRWSGVENLVAVLGSTRFWNAAGVTLLLSVIVVPVQLGAGLVLAKLLTARVSGVRVMRPVFLVPWAMAPLTLGVIARWIFSPSDGLVAGLAGHRVDWLVDPFLAPLLVAGVVSWQGAGFTALLYGNALGAISDDLRAAASLDGAGAWRTLIAVELPLLRRTTLFLSVASLAQTSGLYDVIVTLTGGGPGTSTTTLSYLIVQTVWQQFDIGAAAAMSVVTTAIMLVIVAVLFRLLGEGAR